MPPAVSDHDPLTIETLLREVAHLQALQDERFRSVATQFSERDTRTDAALQAAKVSVDAAILAAREAVGNQDKASALALAKSEAATSKQIDGQSELLRTTVAALKEEVGGLKERLALIDGARHGGSEVTAARQASGSLVIAVIGAVVGIGGLCAAIVALVLRHPG